MGSILVQKGDRLNRSTSKMRFNQLNKILQTEDDPQVLTVLNHRLLRLCCTNTAHAAHSIGLPRSVVCTCLLAKHTV